MTRILSGETARIRQLQMLCNRQCQLHELARPAIKTLNPGSLEQRFLQLQLQLRLQLWYPRRFALKRIRVIRVQLF